MTGNEISVLINTAIGHTLDQDNLKYIHRVGRACEASYIVDGIQFKLSRRVKKREYTRTSNRVNISESKWLLMNATERCDLLRQIIVTIVDRELHGSEAGGWKYESLMREAIRKCGE